MSQFDTVVFGDAEISYSIRRTDRRKTVAISVNPDLTVSVAAPKGTRRKLVAHKVRQKAEWILRQQERIRSNGRHRTPEFVSGETLLYLGRQYQLKLLPRGKAPSPPRATMCRGFLVVPVARRWGAERRREAVQNALVAWYREHARIQLHSAVERFAERLGVFAKGVAVREMKTRWGSGGPGGMLRFNWRIVMAPKRLLQYVVAHELCHIRHHGHSPEFWRLLSRVMPDYEQRRHDLQKLGPKLDVH